MHERLICTVIIYFSFVVGDDVKHHIGDFPLGGVTLPKWFTGQGTLDIFTDKPFYQLSGQGPQVVCAQEDDYRHRVQRVIPSPFFIGEPFRGQKSPLKTLLFDSPPFQISAIETLSIYYNPFEFVPIPLDVEMVNGRYCYGVAHGSRRCYLVDYVFDHYPPSAQDRHPFILTVTSSDDYWALPSRFQLSLHNVTSVSYYDHQGTYQQKCQRLDASKTVAVIDAEAYDRVIEDVVLVSTSTGVIASPCFFYMAEMLVDCKGREEVSLTFYSRRALEMNETTQLSYSGEGPIITSFWEMKLPPGSYTVDHCRQGQLLLTNDSIRYQSKSLEPIHLPDTRETTNITVQLYHHLLIKKTTSIVMEEGELMRVVLALGAYLFHLPRTCNFRHSGELTTAMLNDDYILQAMEYTQLYFEGCNIQSRHNMWTEWQRDTSLLYIEGGNSLSCNVSMAVMNYTKGPDIIREVSVHTKNDSTVEYVTLITHDAWVIIRGGASCSVMTPMQMSVEAPTTSISSSVVPSTSAPEKKEEKKDDVLWIGIVLLVGVVMAILICAVVTFQRQRKMQRRAIEEERLIN
ncbi:hypothetical protein PROFUN_13742 [Planoprotostelium fungivorum]|uniref:Uncharacterized protein n=1 Tax=Planoprotostelium fungivorum TaxID=1890364 RepID=A0A2P6MX13_9EUKA|nr:hypothetical protein PROFUN_13742 [Planoprotostelium fungivorum]